MDTPQQPGLQLTAREICKLLNGIIEGNPDVVVTKPAKIEDGEPGAISFLANAKYEAFAYTSLASVLLVSKDFVPSKPLPATLIRVDDVYSAVSQLFTFYQNIQQNQTRANLGVDSRAAIHAEAHLAEGVGVGAFAVVEKGARIGTGTVVHPQVFIGEDVQIGEGCVLFPGVRILFGCQLGNRVVVHANAVIGSDGFGFAPQADGSFAKIPQLGNVIVGDDVEIGANTTIDRAAMGATRIEKGVKLDNLVMVAHGVSIGANTVVAAQAGIAGSAHIGRNCLIGGQAGFVGHIRVADGVKVQAQSGVNRSLEPAGSAWYGSPAIPYNDYLRSYALFRQLPAVLRRLEVLEKKNDGKKAPPPF